MLPWSPQVQYLGMVLDTRLTFNNHISMVVSKYLRARWALAPLICPKSALSLKIKLLIYAVFLRPILTYGALTWSSAAPTQLKRLNVGQNRVLRTIVAVPWFVTNEQIHRDLAIPTLCEYALALARGTFDRVARSENPLVRHLGELDPDRPPPRVHTRGILEADI